jgi:hypothetical protein
MALQRSMARRAMLGTITIRHWQRWQHASVVERTLSKLSL